MSEPWPDDWSEYQKWLSSFGERCDDCGLPLAWHQAPQGAYACIVTTPPMRAADPVSVNDDHSKGE